MEALLSFLVKKLVDRPDQVELRSTQVPNDGGWLFELKVAPEDIGKVIGRDGRTVNAMRTVLAAVAQKRGERAKLEILDDRRTVAQAAVLAAAVEPTTEPTPT
ncbi:MAG: KH domain-containing protein [Myxococcaceae bacterium]